MTDLIPHQVCSVSPERGEGAENPPSTLMDKEVPQRPLKNTWKISLIST